VAEAFENLHHADASARKQRINETWDEERDSHAENLTMNGMKDTKKFRRDSRVGIYYSGGADRGSGHRSAGLDQ
jgi:hypothetical protein